MVGRRVVFRIPRHGMGGVEEHRHLVCFVPESYPHGLRIVLIERRTRDRRQQCCARRDTTSGMQTKPAEQCLGDSRHPVRSRGRPCCGRFLYRSKRQDDIILSHQNKILECIRSVPCKRVGIPYLSDLRIQSSLRRVLGWRGLAMWPVG